MGGIGCALHRASASSVLLLGLVIRWLLGTRSDTGAVQIHTEGGRALGRALRSNTALCCLNLRLNCIGDEGGRAVVDAVRHHPRLERLDLGHNGLAALSAKALAKCLPLNGVLREVELLGNKLGTEGGALVRGALEAAPALEVCSLARCGLADADLQAVQVRASPEATRPQLNCF